MSLLKPHLTFANTLAALSLFVSVGGVSWAAAILPANSVGTRQRPADAVTGQKVRAGSLLARDFKAGELSPGPVGVSGWFLVQREADLPGDPDHTANEMEVDCPPGTKALGGGVTAGAGGDRRQLHLYFDSPANGGTG